MGILNRLRNAFGRSRKIEPVADGAPESAEASEPAEASQPVSVPSPSPERGGHRFDLA